MDSDTKGLVESLHASPTMAAVAVAGAGSQAIAWLLGVPGASRTVLEVAVPYSPASLAEFLGYEPSQSVSAQVALDMARSAYRRAVCLRPGDVPVVGVSCTASIATDRPKRGEHRCHVAAWSPAGVTTYSLQLVKGLRDRAAEENVVSRLVLRALAEACHVDFQLSLGLDAKERIESHSTRYEDPIQALLAEHISTVTFPPHGDAVADGRIQGALLPGSFNPLHKGHERLAAAASQILEMPVTFELSIANVDKPPLERGQIRERVAQFAGKGPVVATQALRFYQKARLFPGCPFVIGWDTTVRLLDPRYYEDDELQMLSALKDIREAGCRFLVAGRLEGGVFRTLADVAVPRAFADMFTPIPESLFRCEISSTQLRLAPEKRCK